MVKHDTWVKLKPGHPFEPIEKMFPDGFPMRDPFSMGKSEDGKVALWYMDYDRLSEKQVQAIVLLHSLYHNVPPQTIIDESPYGFGLNNCWIESMSGGAENYWRNLEVADFFEAHPEPNEQEFSEFCDQQVRDWIDSDREVPPLPENYEDIDPRLKSPEFEKAFKQMQINQLLAEGNYSVMDVISGKAVVEVLNQIDPDNEYELTTVDRYLNQN